MAQLMDCETKGNPETKAYGINEIHKVEEGDITFVGHPKYLKKAIDSDATIIITNSPLDPPENKCFLVHERPFEVYNAITTLYYPYKRPFAQGALSDEGTNIGKGSLVHPGAVIGNGVTIGENCIVYPNAVLYDNVTLGNNVIVHAGAILGGQAFYYDKNGDDYIKWFSCGKVILEDNVEVGSGTTIDKGVSGETRIGAGTKIDNLVHVGHGVVIGKNCLIAAQCGIGGKTIIEDEVICWGQVGITKDVRIGKGAVISAQSGVSKSLEGGKAYYGSPAREIRLVQKELAALRKMPELIDQLRDKVG